MVIKRGINMDNPIVMGINRAFKTPLVEESPPVIDDKGNQVGINMDNTIVMVINRHHSANGAKFGVNMDNSIVMAINQPIIRADGYQMWYQNGQLHRDGDQPAVIWANGNKEWCQHGQQPS